MPLTCLAALTRLAADQVRALGPGVLLLLGACLAACNQEYANPFILNIAATPPPGAALLVASNVYSAGAGAPREIYSLNEDGSGLTRLTFCNGEGRACDNIEASTGRDPNRVAIRRVASDANGDGGLTPADGVGLVFAHLSRRVEGALLPASSQVSGLDWSPVDDLLVYSASGMGGIDDLFRMDVNGSNQQPLTRSPTISERRPRIDDTGRFAVFERIDAGAPGAIWIFLSSDAQGPVTTGGVAGEALPGTPYRVGSDADPDVSPDARSVVFRRLTTLGSGGLGTWDLLTSRVDGTGLALIAGGAAYRGAPDWGPRGIVFEEKDGAGRASLVLVAADGSNRRSVATVGAGLSLSHPRWLQ